MGGKGSYELRVIVTDYLACSNILSTISFNNVPLQYDFQESKITIAVSGIGCCAEQLCALQKELRLPEIQSAKIC